MSADVCVFHSAECDDPATLAEGWYVGLVTLDGWITSEGADGPYLAEDDARAAMRRGLWLYGSN